MNTIRLDPVLSLNFRRKRRALSRAVILLSCLGLTSLLAECNAQVSLRRDLAVLDLKRRASINAEVPDCQVEWQKMRAADPASLKNQMGAKNQYYDTMAFICRACPAGRVADAAQRACICGPGSTTDRASGECNICKKG